MPCPRRLRLMERRATEVIAAAKKATFAWPEKRPCDTVVLDMDFMSRVPEQISFFAETKGLPLQCVEDVVQFGD